MQQGVGDSSVAALAAVAWMGLVCFEPEVAGSLGVAFAAQAILMAAGSLEAAFAARAILVAVGSPEAALVVPAVAPVGNWEVASAALAPADTHPGILDSSAGLGIAGCLDSS